MSPFDKRPAALKFSKTRADRFAGNWLKFGGQMSRALRRRLLSVLRRAHRRLGLGRKQMGVGSLGAGGIAALLAAVGVGAIDLVPSLGHAQYSADGGTTNATGGIAIGQAFSDSFVTTTGAGVDAYSDGSIALGSGATVFGVGTTGINYAIALGVQASVTGPQVYDHGIAIGYSSTVNQQGSGSSIAIGVGANYSAIGSGVVIGNDATVTGVAGVAIGGQISGSYKSILASGSYAVAVGSGAIATGNNSVALGGGINTSGQPAPDIGPAAGPTASGANSIAIGYQAADNAGGTASNAVVIGANAYALNANDVALGAYSTTANTVQTSSATLGAFTYGNFAGTTPTSTVSVGGTSTVPNRTITNVAAGVVSANSTYAINGSQLYSVASTTGSAISSLSTSTSSGISTNASYIGSLSTGLSTTNSTVGSLSTSASSGLSTTNSNVGSLSTGLSTTNSSVASLSSSASVGLSTNRSFVGSLSTSTSVGISTNASGVASLSTGISTLNADATGLGIKYFHANSTLGDSIPTGANSIAVGPQATSIGTSSIAIGLNATANYAGDVALGAGSTTAVTNQTSSATIGAFTYGGFAGSNPMSTVSVGTPGAERTITNVAAGQVTANSTDAINGSQLYSVASTTGSGISSLSTGLSTTNTNVGSLSTSASIGLSTNRSFIGSLSTSTSSGISTTTSAVASLSTSASSGISTNASTIGSLSTSASSGLSTTNSAVASLSTSASSGLSTTNSTVGSLSTSASSGLSTTNSTVGSLSTSASSGLSTTNSAVASLSTSASSGISTNASGVASLSTGISTLNADANGLGIKYFHTNSTLGDSVPTGANSVAIGPVATSLGSNSIAIGNGATAVNAGDIALGAGSTTAAVVATGGATIGALSYGGFAGTNPSSTVSIGTSTSPRTLTNVAAGQITANSTDAVNGSELYSVASTTGSSISSLSTSASTSLTTVNNNLTTLNSDVNGAGIKYFHANSTLADSTATGLNSVAIGPQATAVNAGDVAIGYGSVTRTAVATTGVTFNGGLTYAYAGASPTSSVSVGAPGAERTITNVAAGQVASTSTDAINGSQLYAADQAINSLLSGSSGAFVSNNAANAAAPSATGANSSVGGFGATDNGVAGSTVIGNGASITPGVTGSNIALGKGSAVTASPTATAGATIGGAVYSGFAGASPAGTLSIGTSPSPRTITNVAAGQVTFTSTDAVNGSELYTVASSTNSNISSLSTSASTGISTTQSGLFSLSTSSSSGLSTAQSGIGSLSTGLSSVTNNLTTLNNDVNGAGIKYFHANSTLADSTATGANSVAVGPAATSLGNNSIAIGNGATAANGGDVALGAGATTAAVVATKGTTLAGVVYAYAGTAPVATVSVGTSDARRTITNVAAGQVTATSTDAINGSQLYAADQAITNLTNGAEGPFVANNAGGAPPPVVTGANSVAGGFGATDNGVAGSTVIGTGATISPGVTGSNVALGMGSAVTGSAAGTPSATIGAVSYTGFAGTAPAGTLSVGAAGSERTITNVAAGQITATSTDATNGSELYSVASTTGSGVASLSTGLSNVNNNLTTLNSDVNGAGIEYFHANSTLADSTATGANSVAIGPAAVANNAGDVALGYGAVTAAAVATTGVTLGGVGYAFAGASPVSTVSIGAPGAERTLTNVAAGQITASSTDAINGSELYATNSAVGSLLSGTAGPFVSDNTAGAAGPSATGANSAVGGFGATDNGVAGSTVLGNGASISPGVTGSNVALGMGSVVTASAVGTPGITVGGVPYAGFAGTSPIGVVSVGSASGPRVVTGVAAGAVTSTSLDAVNGSELYSVTNQVSETANTVAGILGGGSTGNNTGVTNPSYSVYGTAATTVAQAVSALQQTSPVQYATTTPTGTAAVGNAASTAPTNIVTLVGGTTTAPVTVTNVAAGTAPSDAVNVSQLSTTEVHYFSVNNGTAPNGATDPTTGQMTTVTPAGASANYNNSGATGAFSVAVSPDAVATAMGDVALGYGATAAGTTAGSSVSVGMFNTATGAGAVAVGDPNIATGTGAVAIGENNTALGDGSVAIGNISSALGPGSVALGNNAIANNPGDVALGSGSISAAANPTASVVVAGVTYAVAGANPTSVVSVGAPGAERQITNVAAGQITATSTDAVNGSELYATNQAVNTLSGNVSTLGNTVTGIGTTVASLGSQVTSNTAGIAALTNGTAGLVQQKGGAPGSGVITVGAQTGGTSVNFTGTSGARVLSGVAAGVAPTDAVDVGQLQAALYALGPNAVQYDNNGHTSVTLGGTGATAPVALNNVAAGALTPTSTAAVNGSQLYATNANVTNLQNGAGGVFQVYQSGSVQPATASALQSTAGGDGAVASGGASTAIGYRASASGLNSVAIGANSSDGGQANVVSFGSPGAERRLTNVAPGVNGTDAVNLNQLNAVSNYAASLNNALSVKVSGELAGANALSGLPFSTIPTKGMVAAGFGYQDGQGAFAFGLSHQFDDRYNTIIRAGGSVGLNNGNEGANVAIGFHF